MKFPTLTQNLKVLKDTVNVIRDKIVDLEQIICLYMIIHKISQTRNLSV